MYNWVQGHLAFLFELFTEQHDINHMNINKIISNESF